MLLQSFKQSFLSFRFIIFAGIIMGFWLYSFHSEQLTLSALLTEKHVYVISFLIVFGFHVLLWIIVQKASFYDISGYFYRIIRDTIVINAVFLSTIAMCFLTDTFLLK